ncbi:biotin attachment protein [Malaciobacter mytili]|uniref:Biotin attachment protein n=1 Tax=Malaciobacter mytili LMG 24559 TaxID=1032238 RepID=A0AAX2AKB2_9BACT|nr:biotin/lipoyl-containing protein [Malaciobacter mytili]AXH15030.1 oxaloacetate decarboxylase, alpha subunit [Malaciobacter mytili LMG 24559]RXI37365.1 biotin attachment protein [Malaciobacter mytili]RXK16714.1 biotin attachment protein [Malaciobacter mytili LMG 24559]
MAKKYIDVMDTTFRDGFQSVFGGRVLMEDFFPAVEAAKDAGITHFEFGGGARFQSLFFYLRENAFEMMDRFRQIVGPEANLQTLARGINTVMLDTGSRELVEMHAKMFAKHGVTTIRNFDALNDVQNLEYSAECIKKYGLNHEVVVTLMDLPPGCSGAHDVAFYEKTLRNILDSGIAYDSICFKDASGTSSPQKVYETIKMARKLVGEDAHIRLHTHETAGVSVACYLAALEAGADGIDLAASPVSGGTSQPDILTMLHAVKGKNYDLGGLDVEKVLKYQEVLNDCLKDYFLPPEATQVSPLIPFSPMPGGALTANTQMMRDNGTLDKFPEVIKAMREVVEKGGYGTSVTPVSQFYWQQAYANVMFGPWKQIAPGYGKMVLGYFGKTPTAPDPEVVKLASEKLKLEPTTENPLDIADRDEKKTMAYWENRLKEEGIETTEENIFIAAACDEKGITFLKGDGPLNIRKTNANICENDKVCEQGENKAMNNASGNYTVVVDGQKFNVTVAEGNADIQITPVAQTETQTSCASSGNGEEVPAAVNGNVWKILVKEGERVEKDQTIMILEAMKMEIDINSPVAGTISKILVSQNQAVDEGQPLAVIS